MPKNTFRLFLITVLSLLFNKVNGQLLITSISSNHSGKNIQTGIELNSDKKFSFEMGVKYHLNNDNKYNSRGYSYKDRFYADKFSEHFGLYVSPKYQVYKTPIGSKLYLFNNLQISYTSISVSLIDRTDFTDSFGVNLYYNYYFIKPPVLAIENNLGVGFNAVISNRFKMFCEAGLGLIFINDADYYFENPHTNEKMIAFGQPTIDRITHQLRFGFAYSLKK